MYSHQDLWPTLQADVLRKRHAELMKQYTDALLAQVEGVFEITIRSQNIELTIQLDGMDASQAAIEAISNKLSRIEADIERHTINVGENLVSEREEEAKKWTAREKEREAERREYIQSELAQQAAAAVPAAMPKVGRPRKSAALPCRVTSEEVAHSALLVPMNSGSTAHAVARATNLPQG
ncbi:hypothetical protein [Hymenobacter ruber]